MTGTPGDARPVREGRLKDFEDADIPPAPVLPPRRPARKPVKATQSPEVPQAHPKAPNVPEAATEPVTAPQRPSGKKALAATQQASVYIPGNLLDQVKTMRRDTGLTSGEIIANAIEATYSQLPGLLAPAPATGKLFSSRRARPATSPDGPPTALTFRMTARDLAVMDQVEAEVGARSRSQLVAVALRAYLAAQ